MVNQLTGMNTLFNTKLFFTVLVVSCFSLSASAQKDTARRQSIEITSSYKPVLRNAAKMNFSASHLNADSNRTVGGYTIPAQNLFYTYQPGVLKPLALQPDTSMQLGTRNFIKAGFGNYSTPYVSAGFGFGDGKTVLANVYADYVSSKGNIKNQDYNELNIKVAGSYFTETNEVYGSAAMRQQGYHLYGYNHDTLTYDKDQVLQGFQTLKLAGGIRNKKVTETGINYDPNIEINMFSSKDKLTENSLLLTAPVYKTFEDVFTIKLTAQADITSFKSKNLDSNVSFSNNVFYLAPELMYVSPESMFNIHAGVTPAWDNNKLSVLPNIYGELKLQEESFLFQAGLIGRIIKNNFQHLSAINPYLSTPNSQLNTREIEFYGGLKATMGDHFNFSAKTSYIRYTNLPLYINSGIDKKEFAISNEEKATNLKIHGDLSYINQDKFTVNAGLTINGYTSITDNEKAWGTIPLELTGSLRWWAFKQVLLKADYMGFAGGPVLLPDNSNATLKGANDLSAGVELTITKQISAWVDINNIFNNKYQRWLNYPVYGLNVLGGVIFKF